MPSTSASEPPVIVWFRQDLRLADNPALNAAAETGRPVICLYILDDETPGAWRPGGASRWWLHGSLAALSQALQEQGQKLILRRGEAGAVLARLVDETGAGAVHWNRCYEPHAIRRDKRIKSDLKERGLEVESHNAALLFEPWQVKTKQGGWFKVYSPFWRACREWGDPPPALDAPSAIAAPDWTESAWADGARAESDALDAWGLHPKSPDWARGFGELWTPGEAGAKARLERFLADGLPIYSAKRDHPGIQATSGLSAHLHAGDIGPRQVWHAAEAAAGFKGAEKFLKEVAWREFAYHVLFHAPDLPEKPMNEKFAAFPWSPDTDLVKAWQRGETGYPIVDAGMRELWATGTMHNRVRMVAASFLIKHLLQPWQDGEAWFWDTLVDADLASNAFSWQWVAGCGVDAAPYFRIFNPVLQGEKFDGDGAYTRRWVPELERLPDKFLHRPWEAPALVLKEAGVTLGKTYPEPLVEHGHARDRALAAFKSL